MIPELFPIPDGIDRATLLPRFKAFMEAFFFQGVFLDEAGRATLASVTPAERAWFTHVLERACGTGPAPLRRELPWLDEAGCSRLSGAIAWVMR